MTYLSLLNNASEMGNHTIWDTVIWHNNGVIVSGTIYSVLSIYNIAVLGKCVRTLAGTYMYT